MRDALKSYLALAGGVTELTRQRAVAAAKALVSQGEATAEQVGGLAEDLLAQSRQNREAVVALVSFEVDRTLARVGLATADEVEQLTGRIRELEQQIRTLTSPGADAGARVGAAAAQATASKAPAKKAPASKAPAKRVAAKKAPAQAPATKAPAKKAPAKKAPATKAPAKKSPANKSPGTTAGTGPASAAVAATAEAAAGSSSPQTPAVPGT